LDIFGILAYDTIWLLANAIEKLERLDSRFLKENVVENSSHVARLGISQIGPKLLQQISNIKFKGLSGDFSLADRQLHVHTFKILNVFGRGVRAIGIWNATEVIVKDIKFKWYREKQASDIGSTSDCMAWRHYNHSYRREKVENRNSSKIRFY
ncbi:hypothetical protein MKW92_038551, partial [Papaver armeniacum]